MESGGVYRIVVKGHLAERWVSWFDWLSISHDLHGDTEMIGHMVDQAALFGCLAKIRNLGLELLLVVRVESKVQSI